MDVHETPDALSPRSIEDPDAFWLEAAADINWIRRPKQARDAAGHWFAGARLNVCYNAVDRHVINGRADDIALVHGGSTSEATTGHTYADLLEQVAQCAGVLQSLGVDQGDRVAVALPVNVEAVVAMLACARIGAVHWMVPADLAADELTRCFADAAPKVVVIRSADGAGGESAMSFDVALERAARDVAYRIVVGGVVGEEAYTERDFDWAQVMKPGAVQSAGCVAVDASAQLALTYRDDASGLIRVVRHTGGHAVALTWAMTNLAGAQEDEGRIVPASASWDATQLDRIYGPLLAGAAVVLEPAGSPTSPDALAQASKEFGIAVKGPLTVEELDATGPLGLGVEVARLAG